MANLIQRARLAAQILFGQANSPAQVDSKSMLVGWPSWVNGRAQWQMVDLKSYYRDGFERNAVIYSAIRYKFNALVSAPLRAYTGDEMKPDVAPSKHPLAKLLKRPNPYMSQIEFGQLQTTYLNLTGNSYTWFERSKKDPLGMPVAMWNLRPDRVRIVPGDKGIMGYKYIPDDKSERDALPILPEDMMHVKLPNPGDLLEGLGYGLSPMAPISQTGDLDNYITFFLKKFFESGTMLGGVLKYNVAMDDELVAEARRRWQDRYGGVQNWGDVAVLDQGGDFKPLIPSFKELDFKTIDSRSEKRMLGPFGVPGMLIGLSMDSATFSNFEQADRAFWQNTFIPELALFDSEYEHYLNVDGVWPRHDISAVPALQKNIPDLVNAAKTMFDMGTPRHIAFQVVGLNVPETEDGDVGYLPLGVRPIGEPLPAPAPDNNPPPDDEQPPPDDEQPPKKSNVLPPHKPTPALPAPVIPLQKGRWTDEEKLALWQKLDSIAESHEDAFHKAANKQFEADKRAILAIVGGAQEKALQRKATINWVELMPDVVKYTLKDSPTGWKDTFVPVMEGLVEDNGKYWSSQLGLAFNVRNIRGEEWFQDYTLKFAKPICQNTSDTLHSILAQAQKEGWSIHTMQDNIQSLFKQWMDGDLGSEDFEWLAERMPAYRAELIARTETTRLQNEGTQALGEEWGVKKKAWLATQDGRTRDSHLDADGQEVDLDQPFEIGGYKMMQPGDMSLGAPISEVANCRCAEVLLANE